MVDLEPNLICFLMSELGLEVLCKELGEVYEDNRAALEIEKCFVSVGKSLMQVVEIFKNILPYQLFPFFSSQITIQEFHT